MLSVSHCVSLTWHHQSADHVQRGSQGAQLVLTVRCIILSRMVLTTVGLTLMAITMILTMAITVDRILLAITMILTMAITVARILLAITMILIMAITVAHTQLTTITGMETLDHARIFAMKQ